MICCVTGHRPQKFPFPHDPKNPQYQRYLEILEREIRSLQDLGYDTFLSGMAYGANLDFGKIVCDVRDCSKEKSVSFEAALPYPVEIENTEDKIYALHFWSVRTSSTSFLPVITAGVCKSETDLWWTDPTSCLPSGMGNVKEEPGIQSNMQNVSKSLSAISC